MRSTLRSGALAFQSTGKAFDFVAIISAFMVVGAVWTYLR